MLIVAPTGTGKTLAYLLHVVLLVLRTARVPRHGGPALPLALVLAPTRELAVQIHSACSLFGEEASAQVVFGGRDRKRQRSALRCRGHLDILVATCGRLSDFLRAGDVGLSAVRMMVVDEVDSVFDESNLVDAKAILGQVPFAQLCCVSATIPERVRAICLARMRFPVVLTIGGGDGRVLVTQVTHVARDRNEKDALLLRVLRREDGAAFERTLVFCSSKKMCDALASFLRRHAFKASTIHSGRSQEHRDKVLQAFLKGECRVLVATDVAARGLHVPHLGVVVNYDFPFELETYVHRIGRVGRRTGTSKGGPSLGNATVASGLAVTLLTSRDWRQAAGLLAHLENEGQIVTPGLRGLASGSGHGGSGNVPPLLIGVGLTVVCLSVYAAAVAWELAPGPWRLASVARYAEFM
jgi:superfamily II DNA/RNA helicase